MTLPANPITIAQLSEVADRAPAGALVGNVDLVIVRTDDDIRVLFGRCAHRGALMSDGHISGDDLICGVAVVLLPADGARCVPAMAATISSL